MEPFCVDLSLLVLLYNTNFINNLNSMIFFQIENKIYFIDYQFSLIYKIPPFSVFDRKKRRKPLQK